MKTSFPKFLSAAAAAGILSLTLAACGGSTPAASSSATPAPSSSSSAPASSSAAASSPAAATESSSSAAATSMPSSSAAGTSASAQAGGNICKKALTTFAGATKDMASKGGDLSALASSLEKSATELNALADQAPNAEQKSAIQELAKYWNSFADAAKTKNTTKLTELTQAVSDADGPLIKASKTLSKCSV